MKRLFLKENERIFYEPSDELFDLPEREVAVGSETKLNNVKQEAIMTTLNVLKETKSSANKINIPSDNNFGAIVYESADIAIDIEDFMTKMMVESTNGTISPALRKEVKSILAYMDILLESLPE